MSKKDKDLIEIMKGFKKLSEKEKGFVLGLVEGMTICKNDSIPKSYAVNTKY